MTEPERNTIQRAFAERCDELLDVMVEQMRQEDTWDLYLAKGAGDRAIAGDHEERHLLELLQNARDAIYRGRVAGNTRHGRVLVAVTEHGMAMANTGDPFRLNEEDVRKAVRFLQRSDKVSQGFIGHKGVGLKSILLRAGVFSVRSRIDSQTLRATFSRSRTAERLLKHLAENVDTVSDEQALYIKQHLPRLPLFTQPHADAAESDAPGKDAPLVEALLEDARTSELGLNETGELTSLAPYTTVVYLPYRDEQWEQQLEAVEENLRTIEEDQSREDLLSVFHRAKQQAGLVSGRANADDVWEELIKLDRRMLVLLGEIGELQFARFKGGDLREVHHIAIDRPLSPLNGEQEAQPRQITVQENQWSSSGEVGGTAERSFTVLSAPTDLGITDGETPHDQEPREHIRILLETPSSDGFRFESEPLFLYYPIETELSGVPFLIHGPFRVNSSRTALVKGQREHNQAVLDQAVTLLKRQLADLLDESEEIRRWLPWILLPLVDPDAEERTQDSTLQVRLCKQVIELLQDEQSVPTADGLAQPECVHFFPSRPDALLLLEDLGVAPGDRESELRLLASANRETYKALHDQVGNPLTQAARCIGVGQIELDQFAEALANYLGEGREPLQVEEARASVFFLNLCDLFGREDGSDVAKEAAKILGEHGTPILPAFAGNAEGPGNELLLVPAEHRGLSGSEKLQKATRVVFWRPASVESRFEDISAPPSSIPVYFMAPSVITAEGAKAEGILSTFYDEWGTTRFESRPDLFRRVADRTVELSGETVLPVIGYLAHLLHRITSESHSGADDLEPRPYGAIDLQTAGKAVHRYGSRRRRQYWERLESLQQWAQIQVPVQGEWGFAPAEDVVFGPAWADMLRAFVSETETDEEDDALPEERWAEAIDRLLRFREEIGRGADDPDYPELAAPDDDRWEATLQQLKRQDFPQLPTDENKAIFDLLLLLGVRIGPRVEWRWLDTRKGASRLDALSRSVSQDVSRALFAGEGLDEDNGEAAGQMARSETARAYCKQIVLKPYHTFFSGGHSHGCRRDLSKTGDGGSALAAWIWFPDLRDVALDSLPFHGRRSCVDAFRRSLVAVWPSLSERVLQTGWYCCRGWHRGRRWDEPIPSLAAFQLSQIKLWPARGDSHIPGVEERRFPAAVMVAWEAVEPPSPNDSVRFFPLFDTHEKSATSVAQDLQIDSLSEMSFLGAVQRLRWLLEESRGDGEAPGVCWPIEEFGDVSRNAWLTAQYRLLARIVDEDPQSLWSQRTALVGGLALRAVRDDDQVAVPIVAEQEGDPRFPESLDLAFFSQSPRYWEREEHADKWILTTRSQLQTKLYRWAEALGAERIPPSRPPAYTGTQIDGPDAVAELRRVVRERLPLLLGVFKAHKAEKLDEMARTVLDGMDGLRAVEPDTADEAGSSGLDGEGNLVFSYPAYEETAQASQAVVLAEGIALLVDQTTAVGDLQNALGAPPRQVELALHFRGVDLDDIVRSVSSLARERVQSLRKRIERLVQALSEATGLSAPPSISWEADESLHKDWMGIIESLQALEGATADQALDAIHRAAPNLIRSAREKLLRRVIDTGLSPNTTARTLLAVLREAGWSLERRRVFAESDPLKHGLDLHHQREAVDASVSVAVTVALMEQLRTGELDGEEEVPHRLSNLGRDLQSRVSWRAIDRGTDFVRHLEEELKISVPFEPPDLLLIEWEEKTWNQLKETLQETGYELLPEVPEEFRTVIADCLDQGSLLPLEKGQRQQLDERQRRIRDLERRLEHRELFFDERELTDPSSVEETSFAETSTPGTGGGPGPVVTSDQAVRGRVAELFVLQACWRSFLDQSENSRERILNEITSRRREGSGEGGDHVAWSTKTAWRDLEKRLQRHREDLITCAQEPDQVSGDVEKLFKALIEVANERGPGYDVLDPLGAWGEREEGDVPHPDPRRVEIKAILQDTESKTAHRIVLTTNEYHRACRDPESYVLRLISVPRDPEKHLDQVRLVCDIPNPVQALKLDEQIGKGVRGGTLPLALQLKAEAGDQAY
jgi:hypothetical protein